ncbi:hypothetical protein V1515DRAFT_582969 [Lipomyces mesembrius]
MSFFCADETQSESSSPIAFLFWTCCVHRDRRWCEGASLLQLSFHITAINPNARQARQIVQCTKTRRFSALWLRRLYWDDGPETNGGAFKNTTWFKHIKEGYAASMKNNITPAGPVLNIMGLDSEESKS